MATKPPSKARTVSCAWCNDHAAGTTIPILESQAACCDLLQPARRPNVTSKHYQEDRVGIGGKIESSDVWGIKVAFDKKELPALESGAMCYMRSKPIVLKRP